MDVLNTYVGFGSGFTTDSGPLRAPRPDLREPQPGGTVQGGHAYADPRHLHPNRRMPKWLSTLYYRGLSY